MNGENAADGVGITAKLADKILAAGADVITLGNHVWRQSDIIPVLQREGPGHPPGEPRRTGTRPHRAAGSRRHAGRCGQSPGRALPLAAASPFLIVDDLVEEARRQAKIVVVDFHAEATSEKVALARMLDGRVTAVIGTHTHVQTNDARVQPGGTAAITDAGMTGPHDSVIGVRAELAIERMRTAMPVRFHPADGGVRIEGAVVECDAEGRATRCEPLRVPVD